MDLAVMVAGGAAVGYYLGTRAVDLSVAGKLGPTLDHLRQALLPETPYRTAGGVAGAVAGGGIAWAWETGYLVPGGAAALAAAYLAWRALGGPALRPLP